MVLSSWKSWMMLVLSARERLFHSQRRSAVSQEGSQGTEAESDLGFLEIMIWDEMWFGGEFFGRGNILGDDLCGSGFLLLYNFI